MTASLVPPHNETHVTKKGVTAEALANQHLQPVTLADNQLVTEVTGCNQELGEEYQVSQSPINWDELVEAMDEEMKRLDWSVEHGVAYLLHKYNKKSRQLLTDGEALEFHEFLKNRKSKYVVGDMVIVTHADPEFNGQVASVVEVLRSNILKVKFNKERLAREVCGLYVSHYFPQPLIHSESRFKLRLLQDAGNFKDNKL